MKLELKHLAVYLPYSLRIKTYCGWDTMQTLNHWCVNRDCEESYYYETLEETGFKPILRPISDLTKEIEVNGKKFVLISELLKLKYKSYFEEHKSSRYSEIEILNCNNYASSIFKYNANFEIKIWYLSLQEEPYWVIKKLLEWHFDIYGLIDAGLAIDINKLNK